MRISDWSSDVCSSDLPDLQPFMAQHGGENREMMLASRVAARRHHADQMHCAAKRAHTLDEFLHDRIGGEAVRAVILNGAIDALDILFDRASRAERHVACLNIAGFAWRKADGFARRR